MTGCDADAIADGTVSEHLFVKVTAWIAQRASIFYVTSFWASKLFRTSGFLVLIVQFFPYFHHCKRHFKKRTVGFDPLPPSVAVYAHENDDNYGRPLTSTMIKLISKPILLSILSIFFFLNSANRDTEDRTHRPHKHARGRVQIGAAIWEINLYYITFSTAYIHT